MKLLKRLLTLSALVGASYFASAAYACEPDDPTCGFTVNEPLVLVTNALACNDPSCTEG